MDEYMSREQVWGLTCPSSLAEVSRARRWTRDILNEHPRADDAALIVTELGANALLHTTSGHLDGSFHVTLTRSGETVALSVTDTGGTYTAPHLTRPTNDDQYGRGLTLVLALADRLEVHGHRHGRTVTAHLTHPHHHRINNPAHPGTAHLTITSPRGGVQHHGQG
jgi:anti-sigma regulatory factor (Ser/Thr protein kinase)